MKHELLAMEFFGSRADDAIPACLEEIDNCDIIIGIYAWRYGWVPLHETRSITEIEFDHAKKLGKRCLCYVVSEEYPWLPKYIDQGEPAASLARFKQKVSCLVRSEFTTPDDLAKQVAADLGRALAELGRSGQGGKTDLLVSERQAVAGYLREIRSNYDEEDWTHLPIELLAHHPVFGEVRAYDHLKDWAAGAGPRILFLVGDSGIGKTGLVYRLAADLAKRHLDQIGTCPLPLIVSLGRAKGRVPRFTDDLIVMSEPLAPRELLKVINRGNDAILFLDGLDELLNPADLKPTPYREVLASLIRLFPKRSRILVACRAVAFDPISAEIQDSLVRYSPLSTDHTIAAAMGIPTSESVVLRLYELNNLQADDFLDRTEAASIWKAVRHLPEYRMLATRPHTVRLLQKALPELGSSNARLDIAMLYRVAIVTWLFRPERPAIEVVNRRLAQLECLVLAEFMSKSGPEERGRFLQAGFLTCGMDSGDQAFFTRSGFLRDSRDGSLVFPHYSFIEYFIARRVASELIGYDARTLARLNLVGAYNINRLLIPMMLRSPLASTGIKGHPPAKDEIVRIVTRQAFLHFVHETKWREATGYGIRPENPSVDGSSPISIVEDGDLAVEGQFDTHVCDMENPVTNISWYDAFVYCRWAGGRLPYIHELKRMPSISPQASPRYVWSIEWAEESKAHIAVFDISAAGSEIVAGVNPDFKNGSIGLCLVTADPQ